MTKLFRKPLPGRILMPLLVTLSGIPYTSAFTTTVPLQQRHNYALLTRTAKTISNTQLFFNRDDDDDFDLDTLDQRISNLRLKIIEDDLRRPPSADLSPKEFVEAVLKGLFYNEDPRPDSGFMLLLQCSTEKWASQVLRSIGAPKNANLDTAAAALGAAMARPHNQFAILVGDDIDSDSYDDYDPEEPHFYVHFPNEVLDYLDGTAWLSVEFRDKKDNSLLVVMGWQLCQRADGAWLVDQIDWQDYREEFRPGVGREEWMPYEG